MNGQGRRVLNKTTIESLRLGLAGETVQLGKVLAVQPWRPEFNPPNPH